MGAIQNNVKLVAKCGLYCGSCSKFQKGKCNGCLEIREHPGVKPVSAALKKILPPAQNVMK